MNLAQAIIRSPLYPVLAWPRDELLILRNTIRGIRESRGVHAYCVGTAKSGTHSIASLFSSGLRVAHEPHAIPLMNGLKGASFYARGAHECHRMLERRDRLLALELESSNLLGPYVEALATLFPEARFVLPIRDCFSWLNSIINQQLRKRGGAKDLKWLPVWDFYFQHDRLDHPKEEYVLERLGLHTLDGYLGYWSTHNRFVLETVPAERLFVLRTPDIRQRAEALATFLGVPRSAVDITKSHTYAGWTDHRVLEQLDRGYLLAKCRAHGSELMDHFYPEVLAPEDVVPPLNSASRTANGLPAGRTESSPERHP